MKVETNFPPLERVLDISVIVPVLDRDDGAEQVWRLYREVLTQMGRSFEFIFVLDGAHPDYASALERIAAADDRVHVIALNRPFGEAACVQEGTRHARGETLLLMPAYLQVSPESIRLLLDESAAADVVAGVRDRRKDKPISRLRGWWFNALAHAAGSRFDDPGCTARAVKRRVFDELQLQDDQQFFLPVLAERLGFSVRQVLLPQADADRRFRAHRPTDYIRRVMDIVALAFMIRFMHKPFRFFGSIGAVLVMLGTLLGLYILAQRQFQDIALADRPALLLTVLFIVLGIQIAAVGLMAEIVIFTRHRSTPAYRIDKIVGRPEKG